MDGLWGIADLREGERSVIPEILKEKYEGEANMRVNCESEFLFWMLSKQFDFIVLY